MDAAAGLVHGLEDRRFALGRRGAAQQVIDFQQARSARCTNWRSMAGSASNALSSIRKLLLRALAFPVSLASSSMRAVMSCTVTSRWRTVSPSCTRLSEMTGSAAGSAQPVADLDFHFRQRVDALDQRFLDVGREQQLHMVACIGQRLFRHWGRQQGKSCHPAGGCGQTGRGADLDSCEPSRWSGVIRNRPSRTLTRISRFPRWRPQWLRRTCAAGAGT